MKQILLCTAFLCVLFSGYSQSGTLDPTFGNNGIVKIQTGSSLPYSSAAVQRFYAQADTTYTLVTTTGTGVNAIHYNGSIETTTTALVKAKPDGTPDISYGSNGYSAALPFHNPHAIMQADGKIVVVGAVFNVNVHNDFEEIGLARLNPDGSLDSSFDHDGLWIDENSADANVQSAAAVQPDGKIICINRSLYFGDTDYINIRRFNIDGSLDPGFGNQGSFRIKINTNEAIGILLQTDGKFLLRHGGQLVRYESDGSTDNGFNGTGQQAAPGSITSFALQSDGKILASVSLDGTPVNDSWGIARFNTDGSFDNSFDGDGIAITNFGSIINHPDELMLQADDKIVVAGNTSITPGAGRFSLARYNSDGSPDNTFSGDGKQTSIISTGLFLNSLVQQPDGKLLVLGYLQNDIEKSMAIVRYNLDGELDNSYSGDGLFIDKLSYQFTVFTTTAVQSDGKVVAAGYSWNGSNYDFTLARYNIDGTPDNNFSGDGKQITDFGASDDKIYSIAIQSDGKIVAAGSSGGNFALARYDIYGNLDPSFNGTGLQTTDFGSDDSARTVLIQPDNKILAAGSAIARYQSNGILDPGFNGTGKQAIPVNAIALQADGKMIIAFRYNVTRLNPDGSADNSFQGSFSSSGVVAGSEFTPEAIGIQGDGKVVVAGQTDLDGSLRTVALNSFVGRLNTDGSNDLTFANDFFGRTILLPIPYNYSSSTSLVIQNDNKIVLGGYSYDVSNENFTLVRITENGKPDSSFGTNGIVSTPVSSGQDQIFGMALHFDQLFAAGFGWFSGNFGVVAKYQLGSGTVPVTLLDFKAALQNKVVQLNWQTASEQNLAGFNIERSANNNFSSYAPIGFMTAKGNSNLKMNYALLDQQPLSGTSFYRLKLLDKDGRFTYSKIASVNNRSFALNIFPNPAGNVLIMQTIGYNEKAEISIIDVAGMQLQSSELALSGSTSFNINIAKLSKGVYNLRMKTSSGVETRRFVKD